MDKILSSALTVLHKETMKPIGFHKKAATFSRTHPTHTELFNIQASQWNGPSGRHFYVNCGVVFTDLPPPTPRVVTHWGGRIENFVPEAPWKFDYAEETIDAVRRDLARFIPLVSEVLNNNISTYKHKYLVSMEKLKALHQ